MSMVADGDSGPGKALRALKRPAIRPRGVTPPRSATPVARACLPVVRTPARARARLQLVTEDDAWDGLEEAAARAVPLTSSGTGVVRFWEPRPALFAMVAAVAALLAFATFVAVRASSRSAERTPVTSVVPVVPASREPPIPVFDVNSLPAAEK